MKKLILAPLALAAMLSISSGARPQLAPTTPATPTAPQFGACRWFCGPGSPAFKTETDCEKTCKTECEAVC